MENRKGNIAAGFRVTTRRVMRCGAATDSGRGGAEPIRTLFVISADLKEVKQEDVVGRGLLLWLLGIPVPIIILI